MPDDVVVEPMSAEFIVWRCLHGGPLSRESIERWPEERRAFWERHRAKNVPLLERLTEVYGSMAILAWQGDQVVGTLRFYPRALYAMEEAGESPCLQRDFPTGVSGRLVEAAFPPMDRLEDRVVKVHCWTMAPEVQGAALFRPDGIGAQMAAALVAWVRENGWDGVEVTAYEDTDVLYERVGLPGRRFWEGYGFRVVGADVEEAAWYTDHLAAMEAELTGKGLGPEDASKRYTMVWNKEG